MVHIVMVSCVHQNHIRCYNSITDPPVPLLELIFPYSRSRKNISLCDQKYFRVNMFTDVGADRRLVLGCLVM